MVNFEYMEFLEVLRKSGIVSMFDMAPLLKEAFGISQEEAEEQLEYFTSNYNKLDEELNWIEREKKGESEEEKLKRSNDLNINRKYYSTIFKSSQEDPFWFTERAVLEKFPDITNEQARELLRGFVVTFDLIEDQDFRGQLDENEDEAEAE